MEKTVYRGNYVERLKYTAEYHPLLAEQLLCLGNCLISLEAISSVLLLSIINERKEVHFVAVLVDETRDISNKA